MQIFIAVITEGNYASPGQQFDTEQCFKKQPADQMLNGRIKKKPVNSVYIYR